EVGDGHETGEHIGQCPDQRYRTDGPTQDAEGHQDTEGLQVGAVVGEEFDIGLAVVVVADDRGEGQEDDDHGEEVDAPLAHRVGQRVLGQFHAPFGGIQIRFGKQDDEGGDATDDQGVEVHTQGLDQALFGRVGDGCGR